MLLCWPGGELRLLETVDFRCPVSVDHASLGPVVEGTAGVADHLRADLAGIEQVSRSLAGLGQAFAALTTVTDEGPAAGDAGLASALHDFATNWSDKRDALIGQLDQLSTLADQAVHAYHQTDVTLAQALTGQDRGTHPPAVTRPGASSR